ncbi:MAG: hypothetical protein ACXU7D_08380 [Burkholderiaceae bacterium]
MLADQQKTLRNTVIAATLVVLLLAQRYAGFMLIFVSIPMLLWIPYSIYDAITKPDRRRLQVLRILAWLAVISMVGVIHYIRHELTRQNANEIVAAINDYTIRNKRCSAKIEELGITRKELTDKLGSWSYYECKDEKQIFFYGVTYIVFDAYRYDFSNRKWVYQSS